MARFTLSLAEPHGFCTGVMRAISIAQKALAQGGGERLYCLRELVHNRLVVERLASEGMVFVKSLGEVPSGSRVLFSAHGVSPETREEAKRRDLRVLDATCVFVSRLHDKVREYARMGRTVIIIGSPGHDEVTGVAAEAPHAVRIVEKAEDAAKVEVPDSGRVAVVTQTTLASFQVEPVLKILRERFPGIMVPDESGICSATTKRQEAVRKIAKESDLVIVLGSPSSANSARLVDVAREEGAAAVLLSGLGEVKDFVSGGAIEGIGRLGVTAGASTPEDVVRDVMDYLGSLGN